MNKKTNIVDELDYLYEIHKGKIPKNPTVKLNDRIYKGLKRQGMNEESTNDFLQMINEE